jgi:exopolyphosphatase/guanosine-5'-triphosphate,3'-diphosphate pyrophosphatase
VWAGYLDPDFSHSQRVAQLSLLLYDGLKNAGLLRASTVAQDLVAKLVPIDQIDQDWRGVLQAAAFMHDVGKAKGSENHQKTSYRMIRGLARPLGWSAPELEVAAVVARYHRGALPRPRAKTMQTLALPLRPIATELAGVLRLANALDTTTPNGHQLHATENAPHLQVSVQDHFILLRAAGYSALDRSAEDVAAARHLLETVLRQPVLVRTLRTHPASRKFTARASRP